jgi:hemerythrin-like domain-containing protein
LADLETLTSIGRITLRNLRTKLRNVGQHGACEFNDFFDSLESYCQNLLKRLTTEELQILPLAQRVISNDEWFDIAAKFISHESERRGNREFDPEALEMLPTHSIKRIYQGTATPQTVN